MPSIASDGAGGAIVVWQDRRSGLYTDIYAQRVNASGAVQWTADGVAVCAGPFDQVHPQIVPDGAGGAIFTRWDGATYNSLYAQRVNASGVVQWMTDGVVLCTAGAYDPAIVADGAGGAIVAWYQSDVDNFNIYAQQVNASGVVQWTENGVAICTARGGQRYHRIVSDGAGGAIIAWEDQRCLYQIYAQRIRASGNIVGTTLQRYSAALEGASVRIEWSLSELDASARFSILRASAPGWDYIELKAANIDKDGLSFTVADKTCLPGSTYKYRIQCAVEGSADRILFETDTIAIPALPVTLHQNHPNPFNPRTLIRFYLPEAQEIFLDVFNVAGERVARLSTGKMEKGYHDVQWDGRNSSGIDCSSGVYFCRLKAGKRIISSKMVLMR